MFARGFARFSRGAAAHNSYSRNTQHHGKRQTSDRLRPP